MLLTASRQKAKIVQNFILSISDTAVVEIRRGEYEVVLLFVWWDRLDLRQKSAHSQIPKSVSFIHYLFIHSFTASARGLLRQQGPNRSSGV